MQIVIKKKSIFISEIIVREVYYGSLRAGSLIREEKLIGPKVLSKMFMNSLWAKKGLLGVVVLSRKTKQTEHNEKKSHYEQVHTLIH